MNEKEEVFLGLVMAEFIQWEYERQLAYRLQLINLVRDKPEHFNTGLRQEFLRRTE